MDGGIKLDCLSRSGKYGNQYLIMPNLVLDFFFIEAASFNDYVTTQLHVLIPQNGIIFNFGLKEKSKYTQFKIVNKKNLAVFSYPKGPLLGSNSIRFHKSKIPEEIS